LPRLVAERSSVLLDGAIGILAAMLTACQLSPVSSAVLSFTLSPSLNFGRPRTLPFARARSRPAFVRWLIFSRSSFASEDRVARRILRTRLVFRGQVLFGEGTECDTMRGGALQMDNRGCHSLAAETVERPYEQEVELASCCAGEHRRELLSVLDALAAILVFDVFADDRVAHARAPCPQLQELVVGGLPPVVGRYPRPCRLAQRL
jgi:hypothetical protein